MARTAIRALVTRLEALLAEGRPEDEIAPRVAELARPLAHDRSWIGPDLFEAGEEQGFGVTILHEAADHGLLVETVCWLPGRGVAPHDHQTWGAVIGLEGEERNVMWRRLDDGTRPGYAEIVPESEQRVETAFSLCFLPDDIHSVHNDGERPSLSLHIYGRSLAHTARSEFDPEARTRRLCPQRERRR